MTIFFVFRSMANKGGVERTLIDKMNYLASRGHLVYMITYEQGRHPYAYEIDAGVRHIDMECVFWALYRYPLIMRQLMMARLKRRFEKKFAALVDEYRPDVVVATTYTPEFIGNIMSVRDKTHIVIESHSAFTHDMQGVNAIDGLRKWWHLRRLKKCHMLIALTEGDAACWKKHVGNVITVSNPVSFFVENPDTFDKIEGRIIAVGRYCAQKRFDRLINAFSLIADRYPLWHIDIFGKGREELPLRKQIERLRLGGRIRLYPPTDHILEEYLRSQFLVLSSDYEGFALVMLEAMACGLPTVCTDCNYGPSEVMTDGETGLLAKKDEKDLAEKMEWMIVHEEERARMGTAAHREAARFRKEAVMPLWEQAYLSVIPR